MPARIVAGNLYKHDCTAQCRDPSERPLSPAQPVNRQALNVMGDKSPKSNQKKKSQVEAKNASANKQKKQAIAAKKKP